MQSTEVSTCLIKHDIKNNIKAWDTVVASPYEKLLG